MAAPTPVSALVHSSTLVTAGVYLLIRLRPFLDSKSLLILQFVSILTIFIAGFRAFFEIDFKKIIALSTLRQLGVIIMEVSLGFSGLAFFHLIRHALFKSSIFLCAGLIIHESRGDQDARGLNSLLEYGPAVGIGFSVTNLSLCGFPFLAGFFTKDLILERAYEGIGGWVLYVCLVFATGLTVGYRVRFLFLCRG